jgi:tetratricopeptide (TPR) repeat protein
MLIGALALCGFAITEGFAREEKNAEDYFKEALTDIKQKKYETAMAKLDACLKLNEKMAAAYFHKGMILSEQGDKDGALRNFDQAIALEPSYATAYLGKGAIVFTRGDLDGAIGLLTKAIELEPNLGLAYYNRGICYYYKQALDKAEVDLKQAAELGVPVEPELSEEVWMMNHLDTVISEATARIGKDAKDGEAYYNRAVAYYYKKDGPKAKDDLEKAKGLGIQPEDGLPQEIDKLSKP